MLGKKFILQQSQITEEVGEEQNFTSNREDKKNHILDKMETIDNIKTRRSRRLFLDKEIPKEILNKILECAINAPSSMNCQPWHFVIVKDKNIKEKLAYLKTEHNQKHILTAPVSIIVCVDKEKSPSRWIEDGITATENILLASHDLELGAVYISGFSPSDEEVTKKLKQVLQLPENIIPIVIIPIGYPNPEEKLEEKNLIELNKILHFDKW